MNPSDHLHVHVDSCGHNKMMHNGHLDYIHDGELHNISDAGKISRMYKIGGVRHHKLEVSEINPTGCRPFDQRPCHINLVKSDSVEEGKNKAKDIPISDSNFDLYQVHSLWSHYLDHMKTSDFPFTDFPVYSFIVYPF